ncbi:hypothetical protein EDC01DRAFT_630029 [Geopyxis carbonaria]|nr:hypothetical protein EDC01DRAFT_630029 [Geopyxis carbonaria]
MSKYWHQPSPPQRVYTHNPSSAEYSYTSTPQSPRYHAATSPQYSQFPQEYYSHEHPQHYHQYAESQPPHSPHLGYDPYTAPHSHEYIGTRHGSVPDLSGLNMGNRSPSPQYVGRRSRSRASSKASTSAKLISRALPRPQRKAMAIPNGYKPPTVETAPNSPVLLPGLSPDSGTLFDENPDYTAPLEPTRESVKNHPASPQETAEQDQPKKRPPTNSFSQQTNLRLERERTPYASSSTTSSTAASSPPPEKFPLERERRQYSSCPDPSHSNIFTTRESQPHVDKTSSVTNTGREQSPPESQSYAIPPREPQPYSDHQTYTEAIPQREPQPYGGTVPQREPQPYGGTIPYREPQPYSEAIPQRESQPYGDSTSPQESQQYSGHQTHAENISQSQPQPYGDAVPTREPQPYSDHQPYSEAIPHREPQPYGDSIPSREPRPYSDHHVYEDAIPQRKPQPYGDTVFHRELDPYTDSRLPEEQAIPRQEPQLYRDSAASQESEAYAPNIHDSLGYSESPMTYSYDQTVPSRDSQSYTDSIRPTETQFYANTVPPQETHNQNPQQFADSEYVNSQSHTYPSHQGYSSQDPQLYPDIREPIQHTNTFPPRNSQPYAYSSPTLSHGRAPSEHAPAPAQQDYPCENVRPPRRSKTPKVPPKPAPYRPKTPAASSPHVPAPEPRMPTPQPSPFTSNDPAPAQSLVRRPSSPECESEFLELVPVCPKRSIVTRGTWYKLPGITGFHICERCFEIHIYNTPYRNYFDEITLTSGEWTYCAFNTPRILKYVWPHAMDIQDFDVFQGYAMHRSKLPTCGLVARSTRGLWFTIDTGVTQTGFIACEACYEDVILASNFHKYFTKLDAANPDGLLSCHLSSAPFIEAQMVDDGLTWPQFLRQIEYRLHEVPPCPQDRIVTDIDRLWWKPRSSNLPITICEACYCDGVAPTIFADEFDPLRQETKKDQWFCSMGAFQLSLVWKHAVEKKDYTLWFKAATAALSPMCSPDGAMGGIWNSFRNEKLKGFDFCDRCADMYVIPLGFGNYTEKRAYKPSFRVCCGFSNQYRGEILQKIGEAADWRDFDIFMEYLAPRVSQYPCAGMKAVVRDRWWGRDNFRVCEECWKFRVRFSPLADYVDELRPRKLERDTCALGTEDGKRWWDKACQTLDFWRFIEAIRMKRDLQELRRGRKELEGKLEMRGRRGGIYEDRRMMKQQLSGFVKAEAELTEEIRELVAI